MLTTACIWWGHQDVQILNGGDCNTVLEDCSQAVVPVNIAYQVCVCICCLFLSFYFFPHLIRVTVFIDFSPIYMRKSKRWYVSLTFVLWMNLSLYLLYLSFLKYIYFKNANKDFHILFRFLTCLLYVLQNELLIQRNCDTQAFLVYNNFDELKN